MRIMGLDPGVRCTGFGIIDCVSHSVFSYVSSGVIRSTESSSCCRLVEIFKSVKSVVDTYTPDCICVEKVFVNINPQSTLSLGQARGVVICAAALSGIPIEEYTALQIKKSVVGHGHASKKQVQYMVSYLLKLGDVPPTDAADALAGAICCAQNMYSRITRC